MKLTASTQPNPSLYMTGYTLVEELYSGSRTLVYRAIRVCDQHPVILKILRNEYPNFNELVQFRNQYIIAKNLELPGIIQTYNLEFHGNGYMLVMEDFGGISLSQFAQNQPLDIQTFLAIAIQIADILHGLYQHRVIHKDIKPANILIHPDTKQIKLIDFSISSLLPRETQEIQNPNILEGTLAYISPEQTGRMNRGIDYRSDFYSLGVTFYELLTGKLPFFSDDPMELVHYHLAKIAPQIHKINTNIPVVIAQIVAKLIAKNAEERYQNALGLKQDLQQCLIQWKETGKISEFVIAQQDISDRFIIPEKLYGREREVAQLLAAFERVSQGDGEKTCNSEILLVAGFSGIGKTAVVNEVHKPIVQQRGYFIKGKFDQFQRNIPFSAFVQAFRDLMGQLLSESDAQLVNWKSKIIEAVGENGQVIIDVIPELEQIIGKQPPAPELSGSAAQNRFNLLFQKFLQVFSTKEHPLVIFIDDLQWSDSASLNLLKSLITESESGYLLILGAYRDNEVFPAHPLMLTLDEIQKSKRTVNTITLAPLDQKTVNHLVADTLNCAEELAQPLTELVFQKTNGNPFFTTQFLKALHEEKWIDFNQSLGYWQCDMASVRQLALTDDVVEFMAAQLQKLPSQTQEVLKLAACIGNQFDLNTLAMISEQSEADAADGLWKALQEGLILPISETYKFFQSKELEKTHCDRHFTVPYKFLHDRVQQAAYSLISEIQKQATHYRIGKRLLLNLSLQERDDIIFDIVNQLNIGQTLIEDEIEKKQLIELNFTASQKAKASTACEAAKTYLKVGIGLLADNAWTTAYDLAFQLHLALAEAQLMSVDFESLEKTISTLLKFANSPLDQAKIYVIKVNQY